MLNKIIKNITILDFFVLLLVIIIIGLGFVNFSRKKTVVYIHMVTVMQYPDRENIFPYNLMPNYFFISNSVNKGDSAFNTVGAKIAEVIDVENVDWGGQRRDLKLKIKINALMDKNTKQYRLADKILTVGKLITLDFKKTTVQGIITYIGDTVDPKDFEYKYLNVDLKASSVEDWLARTYNNSFVVKDSNGNNLFKILSSKITPAEIITITDSGKIVKTYDSRLKDIYINSVMKVRCQQDVCYYNDYFPIKVGGTFWTQSNKSIIDTSTKIIQINSFVNEIGQ